MVADEVRKLAERSSRETKQIAGLSLTSLVARFRLTEAVGSAPATRPELLRAA